ncbi:MAG: hypothetical protein CME21_21445 [Gemmatimonadetes bacterium]|nr:hypothetical protein [Gemmatimonadota bacterium]
MAEGKKKSGVGSHLSAAKKGSRVSSQLDGWLRDNSKRMSELKDGVDWFIDNRDPRFGWLAFYKAMRGLSGWSDIPVGEKAFQSYVERLFPKVKD